MCGPDAASVFRDFPGACQRGKPEEVPSVVIGGPRVCIHEMEDRSKGEIDWGFVLLALGIERRSEVRRETNHKRCLEF